MATRAKEALRLIRACLKAGDYILDPGHCVPRMRQRGIDLADIKNAILFARGIEPYAQASIGQSDEGWRLEGPPLGPTKRRRKMQTIRVGISLTCDAKGNAMVIVTVF